MASNSSASTGGENNFAYLLDQGQVVTLQQLKIRIERHQDLNLFEPNRSGRTPLMIACFKGVKTIAEFLLHKGANPNEKDAKELNTPLHFACQDNTRFSVYYRYSGYGQSCRARKKEIVQLLIDSGAEVCRNSDGFLPVHCAAMYGMADLVDLFMNKDCMTNEDRLKAMELLGVSQSVGLSNYSEAHRSFLAATLLRHELGCVVETSTPSELEIDLGCKECTTLAEIHNLKTDKRAMFIHGILVGDRILPEKFKQLFLWDNIFYPNYDADLFLHACSFGLKRESSSQLEVGTVLVGLGHFISDDEDFYKTNHEDTVVDKVISYLEMYPNILQNVEDEAVKNKSFWITISLGGMLAKIMNQYNDVLFGRVLKAVASIVKVSRECFSRLEIGDEDDDYRESVSIHLIDSTILYYLCEKSVKERRNIIVKMNHALLTLLQYEPPESTATSDYGPILHATMEFLFKEDNFDVIHSTVHTLIRHGSQPDKQLRYGRSAKDRAEFISSQFKHQHPEFEATLALLCKPTEPLSLQELSARTVLKHRIPYSLLTIPCTVYNFLRGDDYYVSE